MKGRLITLEGGEGAGKSTCMRKIVSTLEQAGKRVVQGREPGGTALGERVRKLLLDADDRQMCAEAELLLMFAARAQYINEWLLPALDRGDWVVSDRFVDASYAYQGGGRGLPRERIAWLDQWLLGGLQPDLTLLLDVSPEVGLARATSDRKPDRFEIEAQDFYARVRAAYLDQAQREPNRFRVIDASLSVDRVLEQLEIELANFLERQHEGGAGP
jgi:dTMP kinase